MKIKLILAVSVALLLSSCAADKVIVKTEYVEKKVPIAVVPTPPQTNKPVSDVSTLTPEQRKDIGILSKALVATVKGQEDYIRILELIINRYKELADETGNQLKLIIPGLNDNEEVEPKK